MSDKHTEDLKNNSENGCSCDVEEKNGHRHEHGCGCPCCSGDTNIFDDDDGREEEREFWGEIKFLSVAGVLFAAALIAEFFFPQFEDSLWLKAAYIALFIVCGAPVVKLALKAIAKKDFFNEYTLMASAAVAAILIGEMSESVGVMIFYRLGEALQDRASSKSRRSIKSLLAKKPMEARLVESEETRMVDPSELKKGDIVQVLPGEIIPVDGVIKGGASQLDCSSMTGEATPVYVSQGMEVSGGTLSLDGLLTIEASGPFTDSTIARMLEMIQNAVEKKAPTERFITRFAKWYTPAMFFIAITTMTALFAAGHPFVEAVRRGLVLLVISCPCALVISIPLGYFGGIGAASARGILVKGANVFDNLRRVSLAVFDKTGTLTYGRFKVSEIRPVEGVSKEELLNAAALAEKGSSHPVALAVSAEAEVFLPEGAEAVQIAGKGMKYKFGSDEIIAGNAALMEENGIDAPDVVGGATIVHTAKNGKYLGYICVEDEIRPDSFEAIKELKKLGFKTYMLTGDREEAAKQVSERLGMTGYQARLLPEDKVKALRRICDGNMATSIFVGDGVNDGPVLVTSDTGIAMGGFGSQVAVEVSDAVILDDSPLKVVELLRIAKKTRVIVWENVFLAFGIKLLFMAMGIFGAAGLWEAVFADVGVALLAVLNATRAARVNTH